MLMDYKLFNNLTFENFSSNVNPQWLTRFVLKCNFKSSQQGVQEDHMKSMYFDHHFSKMIYLNPGITGKSVENNIFLYKNSWM